MLLPPYGSKSIGEVTMVKKALPIRGKRLENGCCQSEYRSFVTAKHAMTAILRPSRAEYRSAV